jgi:hypothetical protein
MSARVFGAAGVGALCWGAAALTLCLVAGCSSDPWNGSQLDEWGWYACQDFTKQMSKADGAQMAYQLQPAQRATFVSGVAQSVDRSTTPAIKDAGLVLSRSVNAAQPTWQISMDTFAQRCIDKGFKAKAT